MAWRTPIGTAEPAGRCAPGRGSAKGGQPASDGARLDESIFREVVRHAPPVSIGLIVLDRQGRALLGPRANEPARGFWFVCGGRILKGEAIRDGIMAHETADACAFA